MIYSIEIDQADGTTTVLKRKMRKCRTQKSILNQMERLTDEMILMLRGTHYKRITITHVS